MYGHRYASRGHAKHLARVVGSRNSDNKLPRVRPPPKPKTGDQVQEQGDGQPEWKRSTYCGTSACVEVAFHTERVAVRDSKINDGPVIEFDRSAWAAFVAVFTSDAQNLI
jgi:hypothetical protein